MNILILGGTGSIGQALTELLKNTAWNVYVTTRTKRENVQNITFLQGNAHDEKFLAECVTKKTLECNSRFHGVFNTGIF